MSVGRTIFEIVQNCGPIIFVDGTARCFYTWNQSLTFSVWSREFEDSCWFEIDQWTVRHPPKSLEEAIGQCRERMEQFSRSDTEPCAAIEDHLADAGSHSSPVQRTHICDFSNGGYCDICEDPCPHDAGTRGGICEMCGGEL